MSVKLQAWGKGQQHVSEEVLACSLKLEGFLLQLSKVCGS